MQQRLMQLVKIISTSFVWLFITPMVVEIQQSLNGMFGRINVAEICEIA